MPARSFLGAGDIYVDRLVDGVPQGVIGPLKANKFELTPKVDNKKSISKGRYDYGQVLESVNLAQPTECAIEFKEVTQDVLVMAFLGTSKELNEQAGTLTEKEVVVDKKGPWLPLGKKNLTELIAVTSGGPAPTTTYVEGVDYELNRPLGWIRVLESSAIAVGSKLYVTGGHAGATGAVISGSTKAEVRCRLVFDGINQADGSQCTVEVYEAVLSADSAFDFLADDFGVVKLSGQLKTPQGKGEPYTVTTQSPVTP